MADSILFQISALSRKSLTVLCRYCKADCDSVSTCASACSSCMAGVGERGSSVPQEAMAKGIVNDSADSDDPGAATSSRPLHPLFRRHFIVVHTSR